MSVSVASPTKSIPGPSAATLIESARLARECDVPIKMDYWDSSVENGVTIGLREDNTKLLFKNEQEYTSPITRIVRPVSDQPEYIIQTENSIYIAYFKNIQQSVRRVTTSSA